MAVSNGSIEVLEEDFIDELVEKILAMDDEPVEPLLVEEDYRGYNLLAFHDKVFALAAKLGPVDLGRTDEETLGQWLKTHACFVAASVGEVKARIDHVADTRHELHDSICEATGSPLEYRLLETYRTYSIVAYLGQYWALPLILGHVNLTLESERARPGILAAADLGKLKSQCASDSTDSLTNSAAKTPGPVASPPNSSAVHSAEAARRLFGQTFNGADVFGAKRHRAALFAAIHEEVTDPQWARNLTSLIDGYNDVEINNFAAVLEQTTDRGRIESALVRLQVKRIQQGIDPAKQTVAIYFPTAAYREQLGTIPDQLRERGYNVVTIVGVPHDGNSLRSVFHTVSPVSAFSEQE
jgi:hypothetical protein